MKKWIAYIAGFLLTLVALAAVGGMSYRMGFARAASALQRPDASAMRDQQFASPRGFDKDFHHFGRNFHGQGFDNRRLERGRGGMHFFSPLLRLVQLGVLGLLLWLGYTLYKKSGWQFVRVNLPLDPEAKNPEKKSRRSSNS